MTARETILQLQERVRKLEQEIAVLRASVDPTWPQRQAPSLVQVPEPKRYG